MSDELEGVLKQVAQALHDAECTCGQMEWADNEAYLALARAAAPILISYGRELAAKDIEATDEFVGDPYLTARVARGPSNPPLSEILAEMRAQERT